MRWVEVVPSPKSHSQAVGPPVDESVKTTFSGVDPERGAALKAATGAGGAKVTTSSGFWEVSRLAQ